MQLRRKLLTLIVLICVTSCSSTEITETVTSVTYDPYPVSIDFKINNVQHKHGIVTIYPEIWGRYQSYNSISVEEEKIERNFDFGGAFVYPVRLAILAFAAPLSQLDSNPMTAEEISEQINPLSCTNGSECKKREITHSYKSGIKGKIVDRKVPNYRNGEVIIRVTGDNGHSLLLPVYNHEKVSFALRELGNSRSYTIKPIFYGSLANINYVGTSSSKYDVPETYIMVEKQIQNNELIMDGSSTIFTSFISESWNFNVIKGEPLKDSVDRAVKSNVRDYLALVRKPELPEPIVIPKIIKPKAPQPPTLKKDRFETTAEFNKRVAERQKKQLDGISKAEDEYRKLVDIRNEVVKEDNQFIKEISELLIRNYKSRLAYLKENLDLEKKSQVAFSYLYLINSPKLDNVDYDADSQTLHALMIPSKTLDDSEYRVKTNISSKRAKEIYNYSISNTIKAKLTYQFREDYSLKNIASSFYFKDKEYELDNSEVDFKAQAVSVSLPKISPDWSGVTFATSESVSLPKLQELQNTVLLEDKEIKIVNTDFDDDIPNLLRKATIAPKASNKWLFAIGIEKYKYADDIIYSKRSADFFVKTIQTKVGVSEENTIFLSNENATAGAIKDQIKILLEKISAGDIVYFYYNGHGVPNVKENNEPYILASDKHVNLIDDKAFKLRNIYRQFSHSDASKVFFFIDSCFSDTHQGGIVAAPRLVPKKVDFNENKLVVLSATNKDQFSNAFAEKGHRLFSYYLMKSILQDRSKMKNIYDDVYSKVKKQSKRLSGYNIQEPTIDGNENSIL